MIKNNMRWETADVKTCQHGYIYNNACEICKDAVSTKTFIPDNAADLILDKDK